MLDRIRARSGEVTDTPGQKHGLVREEEGQGRKCPASSNADSSILVT